MISTGSMMTVFLTDTARGGVRIQHSQIFF
jgi:hypothetical protein